MSSILFLCLFEALGVAQLTQKIEIGLGSGVYADFDAAVSGNYEIGYRFFDRMTISGGPNLYFQEDMDYMFRDKDDLWEGESITGYLALLLQGSIDYSIPILMLADEYEKSDDIMLGLIPHIRAYFNPSTLRKYNDGEKKYKVSRSTQWARGFGCSIFVGSQKWYLAIKYECNTIDHIKKLSRVVPGLETNSKYGHIVSLVYGFR